MSGFNAQPRVKHALDHRRWNLSQPVPNERGKFSNLIWGIRKNAVNLTVYTGFTSDTTDNGRIQFPLDGQVFDIVMQYIQTAINAPGEWKEKIEYHDFTFYNRQRSERAEHLTTLFVGKDADGLVWLSIVDAKKSDRPKIKFVFGGTVQNYKLKHANGEDCTPSEVSKLVAQGTVNSIPQIAYQLLVEKYEAPKPRPDNNNQRNSGNGGGNGGGGYQAQQSAPVINDDTDIPF